jgi:hypothetical protein
MGIFRRPAETPKKFHTAKDLRSTLQRVRSESRRPLECR